jgi:tRNA(Ser,Leu) C12 N-acetylase TAN1
MTGDEAEQDAPWNVLITAQEGAARDLKRLVSATLMRRHGHFWRSDFRNVLLGEVQEPQAFLQALAAELERKPFAAAWLGKALPIVVTFRVQPEGFPEDVESHLAGLLDAIQGKSFHVRVERRGHKGTLRTQDLERRFGEFLWQRLIERHLQPAVTFKDPDIVVAVEIAGRSAGIALISRELRQNFPFVKID